MILLCSTGSRSGFMHATTPPHQSAITDARQLEPPLAHQRTRLLATLVLSLLLHAGLLLSDVLFKAESSPNNNTSPTTPALQARLHTPKLDLAQPKPKTTSTVEAPKPQHTQHLTTPHTTSPADVPSTPTLQPTPQPTAAQRAVYAVQKQVAQTMLYPKAAVDQGLVGTAWIQVILDDDNKVLAVRLARSSGHDLLDTAATQAARNITTLEADAPREFEVPIVFRLCSNQNVQRDCRP